MGKSEPFQTGTKKAHKAPFYEQFFSED